MPVRPVEPGSASPSLDPESGSAGASAGEPLDDHAEEVEEGAAEEPPRPSLLLRAWRSVKGWLFSFSLVVLAIFVAEILRVPIAAYEAWLAPRFALVRNGLIAAVSFGGLLFVASYVYLIRHGVSLDPADFDRMLRRSRQAGGDASGWRRGMSFPRGRGGAFDIEIRFGQVKQVLRLGGWWRDPLWASVVATIAGGLVLVFGAFAFVVLYGPPWLKVLCGGWMLYGLGMIVWGFHKA